MIWAIIACGGPTTNLDAFIIVMNVVQTCVLAYIARRAVRKNREDNNGNGNTLH